MDQEHSSGLQMKELIDRLDRLIHNLKNSNNSTSGFFANLKSDLILEETRLDAIERLRSSGAITQYANFTHEQESLLEKVWEAAKSIQT